MPTQRKSLRLKGLQSLRDAAGPGIHFGPVAEVALGKEGTAAKRSAMPLVVP